MKQRLRNLFRQVQETIDDCQSAAEREDYADAEAEATRLYTKADQLMQELSAQRKKDGVP